MAFELVQKASPPDVRIGRGFRHFTVAVPSIEVALQRAAERGAAIIEGTGWEAGEIYIQVSSATQACMRAAPRAARHRSCGRVRSCGANAACVPAPHNLDAPLPQLLLFCYF